MQALFEGAVWRDDADEYPAELRQMVQYNGATGKLYVAGDDGNIRCTEVRSQLLSGEWAEDAAVASAPGRLAPAVCTLRPSPELDLTPTAFALSRSGTYAAIAGPTMADPEVTAVFVLDLSVWRAAGTADGCDAVTLDPLLFASRPGLRMLQLGWHPDSERHLAVLTSDSAWRLYDVQRGDMAEQTFELQASGRQRALGLEADSAAALPSAFCFGPREGWDRFCIYFLTGDARVHTLCPVVPFNCRYPARIVSQLETTLEEGGCAGADGADCANAWLQRAFQPVAGAASARAAGHLAELVSSVPHALDEHSPALAGPLRVASSGDADADPSALMPGRAQSLLVWRFGQEVTAVVTATAGGAVGTHILAGGAAPQWTESMPQCVAEGSELRAVRCQVAAVPPARPSPQPLLLLLDVIHIGAPAWGAPAEEADEEGIGASASCQIALHLDPAAPETLYCLRPGGAVAVTLPWVPILADFLAERGAGGSSDAALPAALPVPCVEELIGDGAGLVSSAAAGDALCSSALIVLQADGAARCLRPRRAARPPTAEPPSGSQQATAAAAAAAGVQSEIDKTYGELLRGPKTGAAVAPVAGGRHSVAGTPGGQRLLAESTAALRSTPVEFIHQAHHELQERLQQLNAELDSQAQRFEGAEVLAAEQEEAGRRLAARLLRAAALQDNLASRLRLLAELHWALPRPASRAEAAFAGEELPALEAAAGLVGAEVEGVRERVAALRRGLRPMAGGVSAPSPPPPVPPSQLRKVREALAEHDRAIRAAKQAAAAIAEALAAAS